MIPVKNGILVRVDKKQKSIFEINGHEFAYALAFSENYRERNPVVAIVEQGNESVPERSVLICHHNLFSENSSWCFGDGLYAIPVDKHIFAMIDQDGTPHSVGGNIIAQWVEEAAKSGFEVPVYYRKKYNDRVVILENIGQFKRGDLVLTAPMAPYEICYTWNKKDIRIVKVYKSDIVAVLKK